MFVEATIYNENKAYREALNSDKYRKKPIMLDHSCFLTKDHKPIPMLEYENIIKALQPNIVILPDAIRDFSRTLNYLNEYYGPLKDMAKSLKFKLMGVPQGETVAELQTLLDLYSDRCELIGLTTFLPLEITKNNSLHKQREALLKILETFWDPKTWSNFRFHCNGCVDARELTWMKNHPLVVSCDTSLMLTSGLAGVSLMRAKRVPLNFGLPKSEIRNTQWPIINRNIILAQMLSR